MEDSSSSSSSFGSFSVLETGNSKLFENLLNAKHSEILVKLCEQYYVVADFAEAIWGFFDKHDELPYFFQTIVNKELEKMKKEGQTEFSAEGLFGTLINRRLSAGTGKNYFSAVGEAIIHKILAVSTKDVQKGEESRKETISKLFIDFLLHLQTTIDLCPLDVRLALSTLYFTAKSNKLSPKRVLWNILESIFVPVLECPWTFTNEINVKKSFLDDAEKQSQVFLALGKKLRHLCRENHKKVTEKEFDEFEKFALKLVDGKEIEKVKKILSASVIQKHNTLIKGETQKLLADILKMQSTSSQFQQELNKEIEVKNRRDEIIAMAKAKTDGWKVLAVSKEGYTCSRKKIPGDSFQMWRLDAKFKAKPQEIVDLWAIPENYKKLEPRCQEMKTIEKYATIDGIEEFDSHVVIKFPFPLSNRDQIVRRHIDKRDPQRIVMWASSTDRSDISLKKGTLRMQVKLSCQVAFEDENNPEDSHFVFLYHADLKGSLPSWFVNLMGKQCVRFLYAMEKALSKTL